MPELIADLPATAILMPAALVYFLWALFHWVFKAENAEPQRQAQADRAHAAKDQATAPQGNTVGHSATSNALARDWALLDLNDSTLPGAADSASRLKESTAPTDDGNNDAARTNKEPLSRQQAEPKSATGKLSTPPPLPVTSSRAPDTKTTSAKDLKPNQTSSALVFKSAAAAQTKLQPNALDQAVTTPVTTQTKPAAARSDTSMAHDKPVISDDGITDKTVPNEGSLAQPQAVTSTATDKQSVNAEKAQADSLQDKPQQGSVAQPAIPQAFKNVRSPASQEAELNALQPGGSQPQDNSAVSANTPKQDSHNVTDAGAAHSNNKNPKGLTAVAAHEDKPTVTALAEPDKKDRSQTEKTAYKTAAKFKSAAPTAEVTLQLKTAEPATSAEASNEQHSAKIAEQQRLLSSKDAQIESLKAQLAALEISAEQTTDSVVVSNAPADSEQDAETAAKLANAERKLGQLRSTVNNLQAAGIQAANVEQSANRTEHSRPSLLSKVRLVSNAASTSV